MLCLGVKACSFQAMGKLMPRTKIAASNTTGKACPYQDIVAML